MACVIWALLAVLGFWWWEQYLYEVKSWSLISYLFLFTYASCYFFLCAILFPRDIDEYDGFEDYFIERRGWFLGFVAFTYTLDIGVTWLKGAAYFAAMGNAYLIRTSLIIIVCLAAIRFADRRVQRVVAVFAVLYQVFTLVFYYQRAG